MSNKLAYSSASLGDKTEAVKKRAIVTYKKRKADEAPRGYKNPVKKQKKEEPNIVAVKELPSDSFSFESDEFLW